MAIAYPFQQLVLMAMCPYGDQPSAFCYMFRLLQTTTWLTPKERHINATVDPNIHFNQQLHVSAIKTSHHKAVKKDKDYI
jgi:hypothetical protein